MEFTDQDLRNAVIAGVVGVITVVLTVILTRMPNPSPVWERYSSRRRKHRDELVAKFEDVDEYYDHVLGRLSDGAIAASLTMILIVIYPVVASIVLLVAGLYLMRVAFGCSAARHYRAMARSNISMRVAEERVNAILAKSDALLARSKASGERPR